MIVKPKHGVKKKREFPSDPLEMGDLNKLIAGLREDKMYQWEMYVRLSFVTALRSGDVLELKWRDVVNVDSLVFVERKRRKERSIQFDISVQEKFKELYLLANEPPMHLPVMCRMDVYDRTGEIKTVTQQYINRRLKVFKFKYNMDVEVSKFSTHSFRKTFGKYVFDSNGKTYESILMLNTIFNHSSIRQTQDYIGITSEKIDELYSGIKF